ncbi:XTP/dITP diphosphatase [Jeotgalicoccus huakuii]|uniref:XTP/dITP diphosphatase n=1 Tax=Jeotgalicoccus sp. ATCC 8456 TaxID=946435 RepID=UPI0018E6043C|nr:XTP/dITP diphosphatase [Jeotgalicoccus sp. ATCC 8456]MCK1977435.1 XTP/dITP diphosphatase [Jeotgalicoccus huakuii]QQD85284.1 XTP/dITP diphosphatase [Jeotgalicoccus sp. ATCC 8456]
MSKIVIASGNQGKINDFKAIFSDYEVVGIKEILPNFDVEETGVTFRENAVLKSEAAAKALNLPVISDDSGLSVEALDGRPGVYSARYSGEHGNDQKNNEKLLNELSGVENRAAYFTCVLALTIPGEETRTYEGTLLGEILTEAHGEGGFGYDPLFKTLDGIYLGEINSEEKGKISHRGKALEKLMNDEAVFEKLKK